MSTARAHGPTAAQCGGDGFVSAAEHDERVKRVVDAVRARPADGPLLSVRKGISHSIRDWKYKEKSLQIDVTHLTGILSIALVEDTKVAHATSAASICLEAKSSLTGGTAGERAAASAPAAALALRDTHGYAHVEGQVTMGQLVAATLERGLVPLVVPEYTTFTVSGLINGGGIQSTSHRYGLYRNSIASLKVVLGNGQVMTASPDENSDLFYSMLDMQGTFGIVVGARVRLTRAKSFVRSEYRLYTDFDTYLAALKARIHATHFLEGIIFHPKCIVLISGDFSDGPQSPKQKTLQYNASQPGNDPAPMLYLLAQCITRCAGLPWFYQHAHGMAVSNDDKEATQNTLAKSEAALASAALPKSEAALASAAQRGGRAGGVPFDFMPVDQYLARYVRGAWWMIACISDNAPLLTHTYRGRKWLDEKAAASVASKGLRDVWPEAMRERCMVLQDIGCSFSKLKSSVEFVQRELAVYPLWNQPIAADVMLWREVVRRNLGVAVAKDIGFDGPKLAQALNAATDPTVGMLVDVGIWGEPMVPDYRNRKTMRLVQRTLEFPSVWGVSYLTREEMREFVYDRELYDNARAKYHATGVFPHLEDKVLFFEPGAPDLGKLSFWRDRRAFATGQGHFVLLKWGIRLFILCLVYLLVRWMMHQIWLVL